MQIDNDASLTLYLGGDFEGKNSSTVNNLTKEVKKLRIYCLDSCENMIFKNGSDFYGVIYAPNAEVIMKNSGTFNYDASLRNASVNDEAVHFVVTNWQEG